MSNKKKPETLAEWIEKYEEEAEPCDVKPGFSVYYDKRHGFFYYRVYQDVFEVDHTCTNSFKEMYHIANILAKERKCKIARTATSRNPVAYTRLTKGKINLSLSGIRPNGKMYWVFEWNTF